MIRAVLRKGRQMGSDPVLRRWLLGRLFGQWPGEPTFRAHCPPYLDGLLPLTLETPHTDLKEGDPPPLTPIELRLPGLRLNLAPGDECGLFQRPFDDVESLLGLHRFAWINASDGEVDPAWVWALWGVWCEGYQTPDETWAWHPYTAAERAINILAFSRRHGLPGPRDETIRILAGHAPAIADRLEYFGDHHTSNHLANDGRGLYLLGLDLGLPNSTEIGARILTEEAARIFRPSGILREGSSHSHLLLAHNYAGCAAAAEKADRPEADALETIAKKARSVIPHLKLPGGFPLVGDISPDCSPRGLLEKNDDKATPDASRNSLAADGWLRADFGPWSGLWHGAPGGWAQMPGHGHQDMGSFEIHYDDQPVFIDPGRGAYGETGDAALYRSGRVHNTLLMNGADPFPANKPYYNEKFRRHIGGPAPQLTKTKDTVSLTHSGFVRLNGGGTVSRDWSFSDTSVVLHDRIDGHGGHTISRSFCTPLEVHAEGAGLMLKGKDVNFRICGEAAHFAITAGKRWTAYGVSTAATFITLETRANLPWSATVKLEIV